MMYNSQKIRLINHPTPLYLLKNLSNFAGVEIWIKRDDLTGDIMLGGNKLRKFEYVFADILGSGADTVVFVGGPQSNMIRAGVALTKKYGLKCLAAYTCNRPSKKLPANWLLNELSGADVLYFGKIPPEDLVYRLDSLKNELAANGSNVYIVPLGASMALSLPAYADAVDETNKQKTIQYFSHHYVAVGSCGTYCGIKAGLSRYGINNRLRGISVLASKTCASAMCNKLLAAQSELAVKCDDIDDNHIGNGYGALTVAGLNAIKLLLQTEGILLDHVYTAKAFAALLHDIKLGRIEKQDKVLFWHTGGAPGLFALAPEEAVC